ncbi:iron ABC transporter permease [Exiguobacterium sp. SH5S13]|uniref:FecCD family ABC transporter permease n=1 Tax=Exiguobacterium sp. SH5S13 TaxID=2510959 RepID=UPI0010396B6B|nr:iron ABC transporter permease [Exiguobacterium sp. SH5S13]TCI53847.1 iron ABC transporter permease [Exiguobacterium sp. SH5S13]
MRKPYIAWTGMLIVSWWMVALYSINSGFISLTPQEVLDTLFGQGTSQQTMILFDLRLPRIFLASFIGFGLAISGATLQATMRNSLAEPGILGINGGAGLFVVLFVTLLPTTSNEWIQAVSLPVVALIGGVLTAFIIYVLAYNRNEGTPPIRLILVGIGVASGMSALMIVLTLALNPFQYQFTKLWLAGSIWGASWEKVASLLPWLLIGGGLLMYRSRYLDVLTFKEDMAVGLGVKVEQTRLWLSWIAVAVASACVAVGGGISFVGLIAPHLTKQLIGTKHRYVIPISGLVGALLVLTADTIGRLILQPSEIPAGIVIAIIGAPYFLHLLAKKI